MFRQLPNEEEQAIAQRFPFGELPLYKYPIDINTKFSWKRQMFNPAEPVQDSVFYMLSTFVESRAVTDEEFKEQLRLAKGAITLMPYPNSVCSFESSGRGLEEISTSPGERKVRIKASLRMKNEDFWSFTEEELEFIGWSCLVACEMVFTFADRRLDPLPTNELAIAIAAESTIRGLQWQEAVEAGNGK